MNTRSLSSFILTSVIGVTGTAFAQLPNVNDPPPPKTPTQTPPNVNDPNSKTQEERQRERQEERRRQQEAEKNNQNAKPTELPDSFHKASELHGMRVDTKGGEKIGEIKNLAINAENGRIRYAIVDDGTGKLVPIPMPALKFAKNTSKAVVDTTTERMKDAPTFNPNGWNTIGDSNWGATVYRFYGIDRQGDDDKERADFVPAHEVIKSKVETRKGDSLGSVKNIMVDTDKHSVAYAVLDFGRDGKLFAIPWESMNFKNGGKNVVVRAIERDDFRDAPGFANNRWPSYKELNWKPDTNYDSRPPTWVYGMKADDGKNDDLNNTGSNEYKGWKADSKYGQLFRANSVERWMGRVVRVESVTPMNSMDPGTALVVRVEGEGDMIVHLAPTEYLKRQNARFEMDDEINFAGSRTALDGKPIVMATLVRKDGLDLRLRNAQGVPAWQTADNPR